VEAPTLSSSFVKEAAIRVGFDACGIAVASPLTEEEWGYEEWLRRGYQADMAYMEQHRDKRSDPTLLVPGARSVIVLLSGYKPSQTMQDRVSGARIAQYAYGEDYHERIKRMLYELIAAIRQRYPDFEAKPCVDTVPISDKQWARRAGLGWIGRNTLLVNPVLGSYCNIGELVTPSPADSYDTPIENRCGDCRACVDACPNHALSESRANSFAMPSQSMVTAEDSNKALTNSQINELTHSSIPLLDANRCASYHTVENRAETLPSDIRLSGYAFGCDICQLVCPYNQTAEVRYTLTDERKAQLEALADADPTAFKRLTKHTALSRIRHSQWQRNQKQRKT
jgi:epoxyqueuosine reductase